MCRENFNIYKECAVDAGLIIYVRGIQTVEQLQGRRG